MPPEPPKNCPPEREARGPDGTPRDPSMRTPSIIEFGHRTVNTQPTAHTPEPRTAALSRLTQPPRSTPLGTILTALTIAAAIAPITTIASAQQITLHVDDDAPAGGDGLTWSTAFRDLQDALDIANQTLTGTVEVRIAQGTYIPPDRYLFPVARAFHIDPPSVLSASAFSLHQQHDLAALAKLPIASYASRAMPQLTSGVTIKLHGGYAGLHAPNPNERDTGAYVSIISGDILGNDNGTPASRVDNLDSLFLAKMPHGTALELDGLRVAAVGRSTTTLAAHITADDGAMPSISVRYCRFSDIRAGASAGGIALWIEPINLVVESCVFEDMNLGTPGSAGAAATAALAIGGFSPNAPRVSAWVDQCWFRGISGGPAGAIAIHAMNVEAGINACTFENNSALFGAAISTPGDHANVRVSQCTFLSNTAQYGGAVHGRAYIFTSEFLNNSAVEGGACHMNSGTIDLTAFSDNAATQAGGAVAGTPWSISYSRFDRNTASAGGACSIESGYIRNSTFTANAATVAGGAVAGSPDPLQGNTFDQNTAPRGGAVWSPCCSIDTKDSVFTANRASKSGGAISAMNSSIDIFNCTFTANGVHNTASTATAQAFGGAVDAQDVNINTSRFYGNVARSDASDAVGGAVVATSLTVASTIFSGNTAVGPSTAAGGAIATSQALLTNVTLSRNGAEGAATQTYAGGIATYGPTTIRSSILWDNNVNGAVGTPYSDAIAFVPFYPIVFRFSHITGFQPTFDALANTGASPLFADPDGLDNIVGTPDDNLNLTSSSTCIDASDPVGVINLGLDAVQRPRAVNAPAISIPSGSAVFTDRGAVEYQGNFVCAQYSADSDGDVDIADLATFLFRFGRTQIAGTWPDFNADGYINTKYLIRLLAVFGCSRWE